MNPSAPAQPSYSEFQDLALSQGFDEVLVREWTPDLHLAEHTHPFAVQALVVRGEVWLTHGGTTRHLLAGGRFELDVGVPHSERYGDAGATFWVARRHPVPAVPH